MSTRSMTAFLRRHHPLLLGVLAALLLASAAGLHLYRQQLRTDLTAAVKETADAKNKQAVLDKAEAADVMGRFGVLADTTRVNIRQSTVDISDALETLQREEAAPMRLTYRVNEPVLRDKPVAGLQLADRTLNIEFGTVSQAPIAAFLMGLSDHLNGVLHVEQLDIERKLAYDDELLARLNQGERPDVLLTRVQMRVGSIAGPAPTEKAPQ